MYSFLRTFLENGGWLFLWLAFVGVLINAIAEHRKLWDEVKKAGVAKRKAIRKIIWDWLLVCVSLAAALGSQWGSETTGEVIKAQGEQIATQSNRVAQAESNLNIATQELANTKAQLKETARKTAELEVKTRPRRFNEEKRKRLIVDLELVPEKKIEIVFAPSEETSPFVSEVVDILRAARFDVKHGALISPDPFPAGVIVSGSNPLIRAMIKKAFAASGIDIKEDDTSGQPLHISIGPKE